MSAGLNHLPYMPMKQTIQIRPEQAQTLGTLDAEAKAAKERFNVALSAMLVGLIPEGAKLVNVAQDGTVTVDVPEQAGG